MSGDPEAGGDGGRDGASPRVLALIPARGGSKGLPRKNVLPLGGKPLIVWSIEAARQARLVQRVVVSSDDQEILEVARAAGAEIPFRRPAALAADDSSSLEVALHALAALEGAGPPFDYLVLLQPTSPLRTAADIDGCLQRCFSSGAPSCVSVSAPDKSPFWMYTEDPRGRLVPLLPRHDHTRRQDLPAVQALNGAVYVIKPEALRAERSFVTADTVAWQMPRSRSVDIDSALDLQIAELLLKDPPPMSKPYPARHPVDPARYPVQGAPDQAPLYGLPPEVKFCRRCVISNQRPNSDVEYAHTAVSRKKTIGFDAQGVCDACHQAERKKGSIDWSGREAELRELCDRFRSKDGSYDCLVPGSGGKDSFFAAHVLKYKYGMNPLTCTWAAHIYTDWGWRNLQAWIHAGFDNYLFTPNGRMHRLVTRLAVENLFHPFQPFIIGQKAFAPKMALLHKLPLVFYGENEAEYGNPIADNATAKRDWSYFTAEDKSKIFLGGTSLAEYRENFGVSAADVLPYLPANPEDIQREKVEVHYLGYYLPWHPQGAYYYAVENGGFQPSPERTPGTYSKYNSIDDRIDDFHYYTTHVKFGIGRATYDAAQEIRNEEITREEGVSLVQKFDGEFPERFAEEIFQYLSLPEKEFPVASRMFEQPVVDRDYFMSLADRFRSPHLWRLDHGRWQLRHTVFGDRR